MNPRYLPLLVAGASLCLSGCYLVDGAAQLVKRANQKQSDEVKAAPPPPVVNQTADEPPPPPPEAARPAAAVQVEELPPR